jgi:hypothetical protein
MAFLGFYGDFCSRTDVHTTEYITKIACADYFYQYELATNIEVSTHILTNLTRDKHI